MSRWSMPIAMGFVLLAGGCATTGSERMAPLGPSSGARVASTEEDTAYMDRVERQARARGIGITWVHPPTKRRTPR